MADAVIRVDSVDATISPVTIEVNLVGPGAAISLAAASEAEEDAAAAAASALAADTSEAAALAHSETAGGYAAAVLDAVDDLPAEATLPLQAVNRAALAAFTGMTAGRQAFLSEAGREGVFRWSAADNSANVTADPLQGLYVAPASDTDGSSGAWVRVRPPGEVHVGWFGVLGDGVLVGGVYVGSDPVAETAACRAAIALGDVIKFGPLAYVLHDLNNLLATDGKTFQGAGRGKTKLCKMPLPAGETQAAARSFIENNGGMVRDLDIYIQKSGQGRGASQRMNALLYTGTNPRAENVSVYDVTGYGHFVASATGGYAHNVSATNCDVHFEPINSVDFVFEGFQWFEGDNDCGSNRPIEIYRNISETDNITFRDGSGDVMAGEIVAIGLTTGPLSNLLFDNVRGTTTGAVNTFYVVREGAGTDRLDGLRVTGCTFVSTAPSGNGMSINYVDDVQLASSTLAGGNVSLVIGADVTNVKVAKDMLFDPPLIVPDTVPYTYQETSASTSSTAFASAWGALLKGPDDTVGNVVRAVMEGLNTGQIYLEQINEASGSGSFALRVRNPAGMLRAFHASGPDARLTFDFALSGTLAKIPDHADDAAAATGGVPVGGFYRTGSALKIRTA